MTLNKEPRIIAFSGHKGSGKDTAYNMIRSWRPEAETFAFAEVLKRMCIDILGCEERQMYGSDEDKNSLVPHLLWENFPIPAYFSPNSEIFKNSIYLKDVDGITEELLTFTKSQRKTGPMTAREVMQYWATEIFRKQYPNVWIDACIRKIQKSNCPLAIITDLRFPNEVDAIQSIGGKVIRLTRNPHPEDSHQSETLLDPRNYDQSKFDHIIDNANMTLQEFYEALHNMMEQYDWDRLVGL